MNDDAPDTGKPLEAADSQYQQQASMADAAVTNALMDALQSGMDAGALVAGTCSAITRFLFVTLPQPVTARAIIEAAIRAISAATEQTVAEGRAREATRKLDG